MKYEVFKERPSDKNAYAVALIKALEFPAGCIPRDDVIKPATGVVAAYDFGDGWCWCNLSHEEKSAIGDALMAINAKFDDWHWCLQYEDGVTESQFESWAASCSEVRFDTMMTEDGRYLYASTRMAYEAFKFGASLRKDKCDELARERDELAAIVDEYREIYATEIDLDAESSLLAISERMDKAEERAKAARSKT